ncbi:hypothetical protein RvY_13837 [Ramazzottius varieornatus]|uniref:Uncharacterized protein n=1 Tax=Ramazzottius varieornatus TaxID=947166 RepID=A0A1D1VP92_RAMVA|nr:hypothetical protein RvY_13837 [Ramazzottius varieornatus]
MVPRGKEKEEMLAGELSSQRWTDGPMAQPYCSQLGKGDAKEV